MKYKIEFTAEELQVLSTALADLPYKMAAPVILNINSQIQAQLAEQEVKEEE